MVQSSQVCLWVLREWPEPARPQGSAWLWFPPSPKKESESFSLKSLLPLQHLRTLQLFMDSATVTTVWDLDLPAVVFRSGPLLGGYKPVGKESSAITSGKLLPQILQHGSEVSRTHFRAKCLGSNASPAMS